MKVFLVFAFIILCSSVAAHGDWYTMGTWNVSQIMESETLESGEKFVAEGYVSCDTGIATEGCEFRVCTGTEQREYSLGNGTVAFRVHGVKVGSDNNIVHIMTSVPSGASGAMYHTGERIIIEEPFFLALIGLCGILVSWMFVDGVISSLVR